MATKQKKSSSANGRAIKRERGGGVKAGPLRKKELFLKLFFYFVAILKIRIILL